MNNIYSYCFLPVYNPSTGEKIGCVPDMNIDDTEKAIQYAAEAFETWRDTTAKVEFNQANIYQTCTAKVECYPANIYQKHVQLR